MILIGMRCDYVFQNPVRAVIVNVFYYRRGRTLSGARVDKDFGVAGLNQRTVAGIFVSQH